MRVLLVAATEAEVGPVVGRDWVVHRPSGRESRDIRARGHDIDVLITRRRNGGDRRVVFARTFRERYDLALNLGVCGSFRPEIFPGAVVHVVSDRLRGTGCRRRRAFLTIQDMQLLGDDEFPFTGGRLVNASPPVHGALDQLRAVNGITVNTVHGNDDSIARVDERFQPAGREHGRRSVHVRLPDSRCAVRAGARGLEHGRAAKSRGVEARRGDRATWRHALRDRFWTP